MTKSLFLIFTHRKNIIWTILITSLLGITVSACGLTSNASPQAGTEQVARASSIDAAQLEKMETAQALATQMQGGDPIATAAAFVTAQAKAYEQEMASLPTLNPPPPQTPSPIETEGNSSKQEIPEDIPIPDGEIDNLYSSATFLSFTTLQDIKTLTQFYLTHMSAFGWKYDEAGTYIGETDSQLNYQKQQKKTTISMHTNPVSGIVTVVISVYQK